MFVDRAGSRMHVLHGGVWLTEPGSLADRVAGPGEWLRIEHRGRAVAEALGPSRVRVHAPSRGVAPAWLRALRRVAVRGRDLLRTTAWPRAAATALALLVSVGMPELLARAFRDAGAGVIL